MKTNSILLFTFLFMLNCQKKENQEKLSFDCCGYNCENIYRFKVKKKIEQIDSGGGFYKWTYGKLIYADTIDYCKYQLPLYKEYSDQYGLSNEGYYKWLNSIPYPIIEGQTSFERFIIYWEVYEKNLYTGKLILSYEPDIPYN
jgi:hypothetical protein